MVLLRHLQGGLNGFRAATDEVDSGFLVGRETRNLGGEFRGSRSNGATRGVADVQHLVINRVCDLFAAVPDVLKPHAGHSVEPLLALHILDPDAFAALHQLDTAIIHVAGRVVVRPEVVGRLLFQFFNLFAG